MSCASGAQSAQNANRELGRNVTSPRRQDTTRYSPNSQDATRRSTHTSGRNQNPSHHVPNSLGTTRRTTDACVTGAPCRKMDPKSATAPKIPFVESATQKYREESER